MYNLLLKIRYALIPKDTMRERLYQMVFVIYGLIRTHGLRALIGQARAHQPTLPTGRSVLSRRGIATTFQVWRSFLVRGLGSTMLVQTAYSYQAWMTRTEPDKPMLEKQRQAQAKLSYRPLISILTPVYNPGLDVLRDTIHSVLNQTYPHWEFCLANASTNEAVRQVLDEFAQQDERICVVHLAENLGISGNSNRALDMAQGEYVALLDHDDLLAPDMLYEIATAVNEDPDIDIIYFDEDKISEDGQTRTAPWFKPSKWSPDLLLSTNILMHSVLRRQLVVDAGGFDPEMDGAQDWDLSLRLMEQQPHLRHIPRVFYHWRQVEGSAARDANAKPWAYAAQERCIEAHLQRLGASGAQVSFPRLGTVRIIWPPQHAKVSIIIPTKNNLALLQACLTSIFEKTTYANYEVLVVDNNSDDPDVAAYYQTLADHERVRLLDYPHPFNFHTINNWAARQSTGDVLVFLNNDTEVIEPTWLEELVGWAMRPAVGVVGAKLKRPNGKIQHAGMIMGLMGHASHIFEDCDDHVYTPFGSVDWYRNYMSVTGACMAVRRSVFEEVDGLDETYIVGYGDIDFCLRVVEAGYRVVYTPFAELLHHEGGTRGLSLPASDVLRASVKMHKTIEAGDGYFNPNLSYASRQPLVVLAHEEKRGDRLVRIMREFGLVGFGMSTAEWHDILAHMPPDFGGVKAVADAETRDEGQHNLRILIVSHELTRSGAPILLFRLAKHMQKQGYEVQVVCSVDGDLKKDFLAHDIPVTISPHLLQDARATIPLLYDVDVVLCNTILTWRVIYAARAFNRTAVWMLHETHMGVAWATEQPFMGRALRAADQVVFPSETTANLYRDFFPPQQELLFLHAGLDVNTELEVTTAVIDKQPDQLHVLCLATIEKRKGQDILLDAFTQLPRDVAQKVHLHIIGRKHIDRWFARKIRWRAFWRNNIYLLNEIPSDQASQYLLQCDVFALTSRDEALPLSLIEAMALGRAIVCTKVGGVAEVISSGENGLVAESGDAQTLAHYLTQLYQDPTLRRRLGEAARADYKEQYTMTHFGDGIIGIIDTTRGTHTI
jgi:glycosyltransferase involved in cell wall biosynthesis